MMANMNLLAKHMAVAELASSRSVRCLAICSFMHQLYAMFHHHFLLVLDWTYHVRNVTTTTVFMYIHSFVLYCRDHHSSWIPPKHLFVWKREGVLTSSVFLATKYDWFLCLLTVCCVCLWTISFFPAFVCTCMCVLTLSSISRCETAYSAVFLYQPHPFSTSLPALLYPLPCHCSQPLIAKLSRLSSQMYTYLQAAMRREKLKTWTYTHVSAVVPTNRSMNQSSQIYLKY